MSIKVNNIKFYCQESEERLLKAMCIENAENVLQEKDPGNGNNSS